MRIHRAWGRANVLVALAAIAFAGAASGCGGRSRQRESRTPRVAVVEFQGKRASPWEDKVMQLVASQKRWELVSPDAYAWTARKIGARGQNETDVARVAGELNATAVIAGKLVGKSKRGKLELVVRDGETGKVIDKLTLRVRRGKLTKKGDRLLENKLLAALAEGTETAPGPARARGDTNGSRAKGRFGKAEPEPKAEPERKAESKPKAEPKQAAADKKPDKAPVKQPAKAPAKQADKKPDAKPTKKPAEVDRSPGEPVDIATDDSGQAIDDEMPAVLNDKKK